MWWKMIELGKPNQANNLFLWNVFKMSLPGGNDCLSFSAFSLSVITRVYRNLEHRTLNLVFSVFFLILTAKNISIFQKRVSNIHVLVMYLKC